ncbi:hypothetical protein I0E51_06205 [Pseudomonas lalucatii]|nr:hypothetical protein [Pseudomonas lalucatii]
MLENKHPTTQRAADAPQNEMEHLLLQRFRQLTSQVQRDVLGLIEAIVQMSR